MEWTPELNGHDLRITGSYSQEMRSFLRIIRKEKEEEKEKEKEKKKKKKKKK